MTPDQPTPPSEEHPLSFSLFTLANALTLVRLVLAPVIAILIVDGEDLLAAGLFAVAVTSDLADGPVARWRGGVTAFGSLLDHGTDAFFVTLGLAALAARGLVPIVLAPLIVFAFIQYTLDSRALAGERLRASFLGRWNGILYFALLGTPLIRNSIGLSHPGDTVVRVMGWLLVFSTLISMLDRFLALRRRRVA